MKKYLLMEMGPEGPTLVDSATVTDEERRRIIDGVARFLGVHAHLCTEEHGNNEGMDLMFTKIGELEIRLRREEELARVYLMQRDQALQEHHVAEKAARHWERIATTHQCPTEPTTLEQK